MLGLTEHILDEKTFAILRRFCCRPWFQRIWVVNFSKGFTGVKVKINNSWLNRNYNRSIFGGTLFAAADPFYPVLFHQLFTKKGYKVMAWSKSAEIQFLKPTRF